MMGFEIYGLTAWGALGLMLLLLAALVQGRTKPAVAFSAAAVLCHLLGWVEQATFLGGYTNSALASLLLLLLLTPALERSALMGLVHRNVFKNSEKATLLRLTTVTMALSAFMNNTAVVAGMLSAIKQQANFAPSRLLIPLSYASILGGITTLVGTSTNLVVNSLLVQAGMPSLGMFDFMWVGLPVALVCGGVLLMVSRWLPHNGTNSREVSLQFLMEATVRSNSALVGKTIDENGLRGLDGLYLLEIMRTGHLISPVSPSEVIQAGDHLVFVGERSKMQTLHNFDGLELFGAQMPNDLLQSNLVEAVVAPHSELVNKTPKEVDFRALFDAAVVGVRRGDLQLQGQIGRIPLQAGDSLLLAVGADFKNNEGLARNFYILNREGLKTPLTPLQNVLTLGGFGLVIGASAMGWLPLLNGLLVLMGVLLATGVLQAQELRRHFPFNLWLMVGGALTLAAALSSTGAADLLAKALAVLMDGQGMLGALVGVYVLTWVLTEMVTNNAAAALAFPVALSAANALGVDPLPFVMVVAYAASACFLLPFGYQTHLMVYSAGGYKVTDFAKVGWLVSVVYALAVVSLSWVVFV
jgi:di/tricarboxylate transporter